MSGTLALASAIAEMDRAALRSLVRLRRPQAPANVSDPIGLAAELLRPEAILRAITSLERRALSTLLDLGGAPDPEGPVLAELRSLGLLGVEQSRPVLLPEVTEVLRRALREAGVELDRRPVDSAAEPAAAAPDPEPDSGSWVTAALTAVAQAAECLRVLRERPGRLNRNGGVAVLTVRGLAETIGAEPAQAAQALAAIERAALVAAAESTLVASGGADDWLRLDHRSRWLELAAKTLDAMPGPLRTAFERSGSLAAAAAAMQTMFPLLPAAEIATIERFAAAADYLGLAAEGRLSRLSELLYAGDRPAADELAERRLPGTAPGVYVQPDLSVIVPGPLAPRDEADLTSLTVPEHIGVASTRRITEASLADALERGVTPAGAREIFERISLTGIPQPLDYLLRSLTERVGNIVVSEHTGDEGRTRIAVSRGELADTLLVDRALQHLQLQRSDAETLTSRLRADHVLAALTDARYHASGPRRERTDDAAPAAHVSEGGGSQPDRLPEALEELVERVHSAARSEPGTGDFTRRLELAIRDRAPVRVTAEARGQARTFVLLPASLNAGRLRATDQAAGVERTLPVSMITSVEPA
ncbi:helicase-associated domain-containing protein [Leucobacter sp. wl10]|uniref:helicase-associated domain-containing protein n=1 Tax=Leucobacter sp. wl10 TaxID=2304677 RepID=UPI000E5ADE2C|nr:helicase-associated domain-containing protein [Leucobacter sp. wl10]RGE16745.1 hypothetical protein D1J51_16605 [Leucobacter sp. wl10]